MNTNFAHSILHIDADSFFVSCEEARRPDLRGLPIATGYERGIISALNYKAKSYGLKRAIRIDEAKRLCPNLVVLSSDYRTYTLYSQRMFKIVARFCENIEEYSIDECFVDLSGFRDKKTLVYQIKKTLDKELGISFSLGLAPNKVLAKIASNWQKPNGLTIIDQNELDYYLKDLDLEKIWGIGSKTKELLNNLGIYTALNLAKKDYDFIKQFAKPCREIWQELNGNLVYSLNLEKKLNYFSISKTKTFKKSSDYSYIFSQLSKNLEEACFKLRNYNLVTKKIIIFLKSSDLQIYDYKFNLDFSTNNPLDIIDYIEKYLPIIFNNKLLYRSTGIFLLSLNQKVYQQNDLFGHLEKQEKFSQVFKRIDAISQKYGKASVFLASSFKARKDLEISSKSINIPYLGTCN